MPTVSDEAEAADLARVALGGVPFAPALRFGAMLRDGTSGQAPWASRKKPFYLRPFDQKEPVVSVVEWTRMNDTVTLQRCVKHRAVSATSATA